ncbi:MAG: 2Fe-2S iron-sulfur cluster-binding protein, partial [Planctomycetota bacterium]
MTDVRFTIDGKEVVARPNQTVLQAALDNDIHIPHLCYHPALSPFAGCRLCIVEIKGGKAPIASCALPVKEGMEVTAQSDKLHQFRKTALDLILSDHPLNCLTCEKNGIPARPNDFGRSGGCALQKYAYEFGIEKTSYEGERTTYPNETGNPLIEMSYQTCIMCGRCVIACNEAVANEAIDFTRRGFAAKITTPLEIPRKDSDCVFCGACVDVCPVGALTDLTARFKGRISECEKAAVICPYCGCGCSILLDIKDNAIIRARGNPAGPANHGWLCIKGHFGMDFVRHPDRLGKPQINTDSNTVIPATPNGIFINESSAGKAGIQTNKNWTPASAGVTYSNLQLPSYPSCALDESIAQSRQRLQKPLIRKDGVLCESTWAEAIDLVVNKFTQLKKEHGSESLAALASAKCSNEENYLMQKLSRVLFGNNNIDHCARLCHSSTVAGLAQSFGSAAMTNSIDEIENADCILVIG